MPRTIARRHPVAKTKDASCDTKVPRYIQHPKCRVQRLKPSFRMSKKNGKPFQNSAMKLFQFCEACVSVLEKNEVEKYSEARTSGCVSCRRSVIIAYCLLPISKRNPLFSTPSQQPLHSHLLLQRRVNYVQKFFGIQKIFSVFNFWFDGQCKVFCHFTLRNTFNTYFL